MPKHKKTLICVTLLECTLDDNAILHNTQKENDAVESLVSIVSHYELFLTNIACQGKIFNLFSKNNRRVSMPLLH